MTRTKQKEAERHYVESFFRSLFYGDDHGIIFESSDPPAPDILVHGALLLEIAGAGTESIAIEVTGYHPAASGCEPFRRTEVDSRWQSELLPTIDAARLANPAMKNIAARLHFKNTRLPTKRHHRLIAEDLIRAVEAAVPRIPSQRWIQVSFLPKEPLSKIPKYAGDWTFLAAEDFPIASEHLDMIRLESNAYFEWPPWWCPSMIGGWNSPSTTEFLQILEKKLEKAKKYDTQGQPLWLLIVAEFANDLESHIFPREIDDLGYMQKQIAATGFDFVMGSFQQVWLFSEFSQACIRLHPSDPVG